MKNTIKKIISIVLCSVILFAMGGFASSAAKYADPVFSLTVVSEDSSKVVVSLDLVSGKFNNFDFKFNAKSGYRCVKLERGDALNTFTIDVESVSDSYNVNNGMVSGATVEQYYYTGSFYKATFVKENGGSFSTGDITVKFDECGISDEDDTSVKYTLFPKINYPATNNPVVNVVLSETSVAMNYKNSKTLTYETNAPAGSAVKWTSSDDSVVTVDENGNVYAAGTGDATVTCTITDASGNVIAEASCDFNVSYTVLQWIIIIVLFGWLWY